MHGLADAHTWESFHFNVSKPCNSEPEIVELANSGVLVDNVGVKRKENATHFLQIVCL